MSDLYRRLCASLYTKRRRTISFSDWIMSMVQQPHDLFLDAQRIVAELFPTAIQCTCASADSKRYSFINYYIQHHLHMLAFFTPLQPAEIKRYLNILMSRHIVRDLVRYQSTADNPRMLQSLIEQLGGDDFSAFYHNESMQELHLFFIHVLWSNRLTEAPTLFVCVDENSKKATSVTLETVGSHPELFCCVCMLGA